MKESNTPIFNKKIKAAIRKIKRGNIKPCSDGSFINLFYTYTRKGHWQIEYITDTRFRQNPYIAAFFFKKGSFTYDSVKYFEL